MKAFIKNCLPIFTFIFLLNGAVIFSQQNFPEGRLIKKENMDLTVDPNTDFYEYSNGNWLKNNPIPPEYSRWGSWDELIEKNNIVLREILENTSLSANNTKDEDLRKLWDLYFCAMDTVKLESEGYKPLKEDFERIDVINSVDDLIRVFSYLKSFRSGGLFGLYAGQDDKNSSNVILQINQGGLGMPDKAYYLRDDSKSLGIKNQYAEYISRMFTLTGIDKSVSEKAAQKIIEMETRLAESSMDRTEMRQAEATYHLMSLDELKELSPSFSWDILFSELGINDKSNFQKGIIVGQPEFVKEVGRMITDVRLSDWKDYLKWNLLRYAASYLGSDFANENFNFNNKVLRGTELRRPRWKESINIVENAMGEALGKYFVERRFKPEAKQRALEMVDNIKAAFKNRILNNEWMSEATKNEALKKLSSFVVKIGYTDKWRDYSGLGIDRSSLYKNMKNASVFNLKYNLDKLNKPVDKTEWGMSPQTVNAYYSSSKNEIVFPAGIMQPPFYDAKADDAVNYGGIGSVIGHEITHGFDDQGRKYDSEGNLKDWWTKDDAEKYKERADKLARQYSSYLVTDTFHINGYLTLGENIADLGGLLIAYDAFKNKIKDVGIPLIDGFTPEQRFFLNFSQVWKANRRPEALKLQINTDPHSPGRFRVIGTLSNMPAFKDAFGGKEGDPMINDDSKMVVIW